MADGQERVEVLRELMDRLCDPDLTLAEAKALRGRLFDVLGRETPAHDRIDGRAAGYHASRSPLTTPCA